MSAHRIRHWRRRSVLGVGEAMLEFAAVGNNLYRRGFAGDTLNTCWTIAQLLGSQAQIEYLTRVGSDSFSDALVDFLIDAGIGVGKVARDSERTIGLYVISLTGAERTFSYWRGQSAARQLADDPAWLAEALAQAGLIHVSGISLAILGDAGRANLMNALRSARAQGAVVSFDPNLRMRLWRDRDEVRDVMQEMLDVTDIALPSFDDEALLWGDADPGATLSRIGAAGVVEAVVKNGAGDVGFCVDGARGVAMTPAVAQVCDTTGAGDAFNAGYLAGRLIGMTAAASCRLGQRVAGEVIGHFGALPPREALDGLKLEIMADAAGSVPP